METQRNEKIQIEVKYQRVEDMYKAKYDPDATVTMANAVLCAKPHYSIVLDTLNKVFSPKRKYGYPQAKKLTVIPDRASPCFICPSGEAADTIHYTVKEEQSLITKQMIVIPLDNTIKHAGQLCDTLDLNLYEAITSIVMNKNTNDPNSKQPLFVSLDRDKNMDHSWKLVTRRDRYEEALPITQRLGHTCCKMLGPRAWEWFTDNFYEKQQLDFQYKENTKVYEPKSQTMMP